MPSSSPVPDSEQSVPLNATATNVSSTGLLAEKKKCTFCSCCYCCKCCNGRCCGCYAGPEYVGPTAYITLLALTLVNLFNYIDRYIPSATKTLIQDDLDLTDFQSGFLLTAFMIVYMLTAPIFGYLADKGYSRKVILVCGVLLWSASTMSTGLCDSFYTIIIPRAFVGIGEAAYTAISPPLIADYFPQKILSKALTFYFVVTPIGAAIGYMVGGSLGELIGWRWTFVATGLPGIFSVFLLLIPEPPRGRFDPPEVKARGPPPGIIAGTKILFTNRAYVLMNLGYIAVTFGVGALGDWLPTYFTRYYDMSVAEADFFVGVLVVVGGIGGTFIGGLAGDLMRKHLKQPYFAVSTITQAVATVVVIILLAIDMPVGAASALFFIAIFFAWAYSGPINAILNNCIPANLRGRANSTCMLLIHLFGDAISPSIVGAISDATGSLKKAFSLVPLTLALAVAAWGAGWLFVSQDTAGRQKKEEEEKLVTEVVLDCTEGSSVVGKKDVT